MCAQQYGWCDKYRLWGDWFEKWFPSSSPPTRDNHDGDGADADDDQKPPRRQLRSSAEELFIANGE